MPFRLRKDEKLIRVFFEGVLSDADLSQVMRDVNQIEGELRVVPPRLISMQDITGLAINAGALWSLALQRREHRFPNAFKSALVARDPAHYGFARMFQTLNDNPQISIGIFPGEAEAMKWIAEPGLAPPDPPWAP